MEVVIALLSVVLCIAVGIAVYYYVQYNKILKEYNELDLESEKMHRKLLENAKKRCN